MVMRRNVDNVGLEVRELATFVGKERRCCEVLTLVGKDSELDYVMVVSLKSVRSLAFNQCSWQRSGLMWSYRDDDNTSRATEFITN